MNSKNVICTLTVGAEAKAIGVYSIPLMNEYAKKVNADFYVLDEGDIQPGEKPHYLKFKLANLLKDYERLLFLDSDILVTKETPNVFDLVPPNKFGVTVVSSIFDSLDNEKSAIKKVFDFDLNKDQYFNSGAMVISQEHMEIFNSKSEELGLWIDAKQNGLKSLNDQTYLNYKIQSLNVELVDLGKAYNFMRAWGDFDNKFHNFFIHYAGLTGVREHQMKLDAYAIRNSWITKILKKSNLAAKLYDRIGYRIAKLTG